eukprot:9235143-Pyramimonas_sp.AAC.1
MSRTRPTNPRSAAPFTLLLHKHVPQGGVDISKASAGRGPFSMRAALSLWPERARCFSVAWESAEGGQEGAAL